MYDVAIIGTGPAGLSAALTLKLHNKNVVWFGSADFSMKVGKSEKIANYPGAPKISGKALNEQFAVQAREMGLEIKDTTVTNIMNMGEQFMVLGGSEVFEAKSVLLCIGATNPKGFEGEAEHLGMGVSYCATCDGFFYKDKKVAVYCGAERYEHEVKYLAEIATEVLLFAPYMGKGATGGTKSDSRSDSQSASHFLLELPNVTLAASGLRSIQGEGRVSHIVMADQTTADVDGIFILRNAIAPATLLYGLEIDGAHIVVDRAMKTNIPGCFAAGDCTGRPYQVAKAVGEGNVAAHSILEYLAEK